MKRKKIFLILSLSTISLPLIPILTSCSSKNNDDKPNNINISIKSNILNNTCFQNDNVELEIITNIDNLDNYQIKWFSPQLNNYQFPNSSIITFPTNKVGEFDIYVSLVQNDIIVASSSYKLIIKELVIPEYNLALNPSKTEVYYGEEVNITASLSSSDGIIPENLVYKWYVNGELNNSFTSAEFSTSELNIGNNTIKLEIYSNNSLLCENSTIINVVEKPVESLSFPTMEELHINGDVRYYYVYSGLTLTNAQFKNKFNEYGLLQSLSLLAYMLCDSNDFINSNNYENIELKLLKNDNFNNIKIEISATVKTSVAKITNITNKIPFAAISQGENIDLVGGDKIRLSFEISRTNTSNTYYNQNKINPENIIPGTITKDLFFWNKIGRSPLLAYTSNEFSVYSEFYKNDKLEKYGPDTRSFIPFIYYAESEYTPGTAGYYLGQTTCIKN